MDNEDRIWLNNNLFRYEDTKYGTNGILNISASLSTTDNKNFSPLRLIVSISQNNYKKICTLAYTDVIELLNSLTEITSLENLKIIYDQNSPTDIERKYSNKILKFLFKKAKDLNHCVLIGIYSNETDKSLLVITIDMFKSLVDILNQFKDNYFTIENSVINRYLTSLQIEELNNLNQFMRIIPKTLDEIYETIKEISKSNLSSNNFNKVVENNDEDIENDDNIQSSLDSFVNDFEKILVPDIENFKHEEESKNKEEVQEIESKFIDKVLKNDIENLCSYIRSIKFENAKILKFSELVNSELGFDCLENFSQKDLKSAVYLSELKIKTNHKNYYFNGQDFPKTCTLIKSDIENASIDQNHRNLSYDLLMIHSYIKNFRSKMEDKTNDQNVSMSDVHIDLRLITDLFTYSFIKDEDKEVVINNVNSRYKWFYNNGFFNKLNVILENNNLQHITSEEISKYVRLVFEKLQSSVNISKLQDSAHQERKLKLPSDNNFSLEQITNEFVNLEILYNFSNDVENEANKFGVDLDKIDKKILSIFQENKKVNKSKEKQTNLLRFVKYFNHGIPESVNDKFINYISTLGYENFDLNNNEFELNEFGENIIKGLYQWNNTTNKQEKYTDFFYKCEETILSKSDILNKENNGNQDKDFDSWEDILSE